MKHLDILHSALLGIIREEINQQPGFDLPSNKDAERSILGAILLDNVLYKEASEGLIAKDFALDSHQRIFACMGKLLELGAVDLVTLVEESNRRKELAEVGGAAYIASLTDGLPRNLPIKDWISIVKEKSRLRQIINACSSAITKAADASLTPAEIVEQLGKDLKGARKG